MEELSISCLMKSTLGHSSLFLKIVTVPINQKVILIDKVVFAELEETVVRNNTPFVANFIHL